MNECCDALRSKGASRLSLGAEDMYQTPKNSTQDFFTFKHANGSQMEAGTQAYDEDQLGTTRQEIEQLVESRHPVGELDCAESPPKVPGGEGVPASGDALRAQNTRKSAIKMQYDASRRRHDLLGQILSTGSFKDRRITVNPSKGTNKKARPTSIVNEKESTSSFYQKSRSLQAQHAIVQGHREGDVKVKRFEAPRLHNSVNRSCSVGTKSSRTNDRGSQNLSNLSISLNPSRQCLRLQNNKANRASEEYGATGCAQTMAPMIIN